MCLMQKKFFKNFVVTVDVTTKWSYTLDVIMKVTTKEINIMSLFSKLFNKKFKGGNKHDTN